MAPAGNAAAAPRLARPRRFPAPAPAPAPAEQLLAPRTEILLADEQRVLDEYRRWRDDNFRPGHGLTVMLRAALSPTGAAIVHGGAHEGSGW